jgi:protein O-mannosyl-transferase
MTEGVPASAAQQQHLLARPLVGALIAFVLAVVAFLPALDNGFVKFDDPSAITENLVMQRGLTAETVRWAFRTIHLGNYSPLTVLSHLLDVTLFGLDPAGHHATSIFWHAVASALLVVAMRSLTQQWTVALVVGVLFAVHPQHVESVVWISERKDVLSAVAFMGVIWSYAAAHQRQRPWLRAVTLALLVVGLLTKPMLVTVPPLLLVIDLLLLRRPFTARLLLEKVPFAVAAAALALVTLQTQTHAHARGVWSVSLIGNAFIATTRYVAQTVMPVGLSTFYVSPINGWPWPIVAGAVLTVVAITTIVVVAFVRHRMAAPLAGWLWFCGMLVPVIGLVKVGVQSMADRYTYLPHIGLFFVVGVGVDAVLRAHPTRARAIALACAVVVLALIARTRDQIPAWHDARAMWMHAIKVDPENHWAHAYLSDVAHSEKDIETAVLAARTAAQIAPQKIEIVERLGRMEMVIGNYARADRLLRAVLQGDDTRDVATFLLAEVCRQTGRNDEAQALFARAVELARKNEHPDLAERAQRALEGGVVTDLSDPKLPQP